MVSVTGRYVWIGPKNLLPVDVDVLVWRVVAWADWEKQDGRTSLGQLVDSLAAYAQCSVLSGV